MFTSNSSLVMVNLFVAIIVSDIEELKREGNIQETIQKVYHIINYENILSCFHHLGEGLKKNNNGICTHSICFRCKAIKVSPNIQLELQNIVRRNNQK